MDTLRIRVVMVMLSRPVRRIGLIASHGANREPPPPEDREFEGPAGCAASTRPGSGPDPVRCQHRARVRRCPVQSQPQDLRFGYPYLDLSPVRFGPQVQSAARSPISVRTAYNSGKNVNSSALARKPAPLEPPVPRLKPIVLVTVFR